MSKQGSSRKSLVIGIIAAVVVLGVLLAVLLTQCTGGQGANESTPVQTTGEAVPEYDLYWNLDRAEYDGKSEAGMSSRQQESDGYFHIRFFYEGEIVELRAADRKVINAIDVNDVMGLTFDDNGIITGVTLLDDMPLEQVGWQFYVQSVGGKLLKLNSSKAYNGLEVLLDIHDFTGIWDMTGKEGEVGMTITPIGGDRVIAIANLAGELTHVYVYDRPEFMESFEAECQHCGKVVEWKKWNKENALPSTAGHYQLQNNISGMSKQQYIEEDQKVCLDLNGMTVDGKDNARVYTLHYSGAHLAIMDTSEGQKGVLRGHSTSSDQGGVVWVRYGQFHLYSGTLDGSDMISDMNGAAIDIPKGAFFYMHGGKIIGGNAKTVKNDKGNWTNGLGGAVVVRGKFVMNDGIIEGGKATGAITAKDANGVPTAYSRGIGGNVYVSSGGVFEMNGGTIKNGTATHSGGNVYVDGTGEFTMTGGTITGGKVTGKGRNGGNVFITSKSIFNFSGGKIINGISYNCGANLYTNGRVNMTGGYIGGGKIYTWGTKKLNPTENRVNVFNVNGNFTMYGGQVAGGFYCIDSKAGDAAQTKLLVSGYATIMGEEGTTYKNLELSSGGDGVQMRVGKLYDRAKIGVIANTGIFTLPCAEHNVDNFISDVDDAGIHYVEGCIALGRMGCLCGNNDKGNHFGKCDGTQLFWAPLTTTTMPTKTGNYYLPRVMNADGVLEPRVTNAKEQSSMVEGAQINLDLNGGTINAKTHYRAFSMHNKGVSFAITDSSEGKTGVIKSSGKGTTQGNVVWVRYGNFDLYGGTLDGSDYTLHQNWATGDGKEKDDKLFGTADDVFSDRDGGTICMGGGTTFNMYGGTIIGNKAPITVVTKTNKITTEVNGEQVTTEESFDHEFAAVDGATLLIGKNSTFNMYAGTIRDGYTEGYGGNVYALSGAVLNLYGGTIRDGQAGPAYKEGTTTVKSKGWGGNMELTSGSTLNILDEDALITGGSSGGNGGNIRNNGTINMQTGTISNGTSVVDQGGNIFNGGILNLTGGIITGGKAVNGGNITNNSSKDNVLKGVTISNGTATKAGGNINYNTTSSKGSITIAEGTLITGGKAGTTGGNLNINTNTTNSAKPSAMVLISGGTIENGYSEGNAPDAAKGDTAGGGGNIAMTSVSGYPAVLTITGGTISGGKTKGYGGAILAKNSNAEIIMAGGTITGNVARWGGSVALYKAKGMTLNDGTIEGGSTFDNGSGTSGNGGNIYVSGNSPVTMNGGTIQDGKTGDYGGNVWTQGTFTMNGGTISGGEAKATTGKGGGNLFTNNAGGKFYLNGGTVKNGVASKGGNIMLNNADSVCVVDGAEIIDGQTVASHGGNVNVAVGTFTLKSGTISGGISKDTAGNIYANGGTVIIEGGKVLGGTDKNGANADESSIYIVSAALELRGGELDGGVYVLNYQNNNGSVKISGNPVVKSDTRNGLRFGYTGTGANKIPYLQIDQPMTDGAEIYVTATNWEVGKFTTATEEAYAKYFHSDDETRTIGYFENCVALGKTYCQCGSTTADHKLGCSKEQLFWVPVSSNKTLPTTTGNYYIHPSVTVNLSNQWQPAANAVINLDLNGRTVTCKSRVFAFNNANVNVTLTDTAGGGKVWKDGTLYFVLDAENKRVTPAQGVAPTLMYTGQGGIVWVNKGSTFNMIAGTIDGTGYVNDSNGGAVCVEGTNSTFNMYGGTVKGTKASTNGGNFAVKDSSKLYVYGGTIEGGKTDATGGNIYMTGSAYVELNGDAIVTGGTSTKNGGNIYVGDKSNLVMNDGTVTEGTTTGDQGGNIFCGAYMQLLGGEVSNGNVLAKKNGGNIAINTSRDILLQGVKVSGGESAGSGGNIGISSTQTAGSVTIAAGTTITGGTATGNGGNLYITPNNANKNNPNATVNITGGTLEKGSAAEGGNIFVNLSGTGKSVLNITGGLITDSSATKGGNIRVAAGAEVVIDGADAVIEKGSTTSGHGGNINTSGTVTLKAGTIRDGESKDTGGNVYVNGDSAKLIVEGGKVQGGKDKNGANNGAASINVDAAALELRGGEMDGGVQVINSTASNTATLKISGAPVIKSDDRAGLTLSYTADGTKIPVAQIDKAMTDGAEIYINCAKLEVGKFAATAEKDYTKYFKTKDATRTIGYADGHIALGRYNCQCGSKNDTHKPGCSKEQLFWLPVTTTIPTSSGNYYINISDDTLTLASQWKPAANAVVNLDLNGKSVTCNSRVFAIDIANSTVTISDTVGTGKIYKNNKVTSNTTATGMYTGQGAILWVNKGSTVNLIDVDIDGTGYINTHSGAGIAVQGTNSVLNVYGGSVKGTESQANGGNIAVNGTNATLNLYNTTVSGGKAASKGGNIYVDPDCQLNIYGGTVTGGTAGETTSANICNESATSTVLKDCRIDGGISITNPAADITVSGKVTITGANTNLTLGGAMLKLVDFSEESNIGINYAKGGVFTTTTEEKFKDNFTSDDPTLFVDFVDGKLVLALGKYNCLCGKNAAPHDPGCDGETHFWLPWNETSTLPTEEGYWYLTRDDIKITTTAKITTQQNVVLDLNGKTVTNADGSNIRFYWINSDKANVTVTDTVGGGKMVNNGTYTQGMIAWVTMDGSQDVFSFTLIKGTLDTSGATAGDHHYATNAISLASKNATFNMYGGQVLGGNSPYGAGAIAGENWASMVNIYGGTITGHPSEQYAALRLYGTKNVISGGTITGGVEINRYRFDTETTTSVSQLTLKGSPNIDSLLITDNSDKMAGSGDYAVLPLVTVEGKLTNTTPIKIAVLNDAEYVFSANVVDEANASKFVAANAGQTVHYLESGADAGKLYICATRCICGSTNGTHTGYTDPDGNFVGCDGTPKPFKAWTATNVLPTTTGYYYLTGPVNFTTATQLVENAQVVVDLNGQTVKPAQVDGVDDTDRAVSLHNPGTSFTLADSKGTGKIIGSSGRSDQGNVVWVRRVDTWKADDRIGTFVMLGGTLQGANPNNTSSGEVINIDAYGKFYMLGGTITGGTAKYGGNIAVDSNATMYMLAGTIENGKAISLGGNIYANGADVYILGGTVKDGRAGKDYVTGSTENGWGGNIELAGSSYLKLATGATVSGGRTIGNGGNIRITSGATMDMTGGTVSGGYNKDNGGNIFVNGTLTVTGGEIKNGEAKNGGNISANTSKTVTLNNVTITGGKAVYDAAKSEGGNVRVFNNAAATLKIGNGTKISGGTASVAETANLNVTVAATVALADCEIAGYARLANADSKFTISGLTKITGGDTNLTTAGLIEVGTLKAGSKIGINRDAGVFTTNAVDASYVDYFTADKANTAVAWNNGGTNAGKLSIGNVYAECGKTTAHAAHDFCDGELHTWLVTASLPATTGYWYLADQLNITELGQTKAVKTDEQIALNLNGYDIVSQIAGEGAGRLYSFLNGTVYDKSVSILLTSTKSGSSIVYDDEAVDGNTVGDQGRLCWVVGINKKLTVNNIEVDMTKMETKNASMNGQLIATAQSNHGTSDNKNLISFYDVTIKGRAIAGSMIHVSDNTDLLLHNTTISGHESTATDFGGVVVYGSSTTYPSKLILSGNTRISDNTSKKGNSNIYIGGNGSIELADSYVGSTSKPQGIDCNNSRVLLTNVEYGTFIADLDTKQVAFTAEGMKLVSADAHVHCACAGTLSSGEELANGEEHICVDIIYSEMTSTGGMLTADSAWYVPADKAVDLSSTIDQDKYNLDLCLNGSAINVADGMTAITAKTKKLTITTCDDNYEDGETTKNVITGTGNTTTDYGVVAVGTGGRVDYVLGTINAKNREAYNSKHGCAVNNRGGTFVQYPETTIVGGTVRSNDTTNANANRAHGGSVYVGSSGTYHMLGGTIKDGITYQNGGNVYVMVGTFYMYDGKIVDGWTYTGKADPNYTGTDTKTIDSLGKASGTQSNANSNVTVREGGKFIMSGGWVKGSLSGSNIKSNTDATKYPYFELSGSAKIYRSEGNLIGNNLWISATSNIVIKDLNDDAAIGFMYTGTSGVPSYKCAAYQGKNELNLDQLDVYMFGFRNNTTRTFALQLNDDNEIRVVETTDQ